MADQVLPILEALQTQLSVIRTGAGYATDIGQAIVLYDEQRDESDRPSIAISAPTGKINRTDQADPETGKRYSRRARLCDLVIEAAVDCDPEDDQRLAHAMREDIERVYEAMLKNNAAMPTGTARLTLTDWTVLPRPAGIGACVLRITGAVEYQRNPT